MGEGVECGHQGVALFPALDLCDIVRDALSVNPDVRAGGAIELAGKFKREERAQFRVGEEGAEHGLAGGMVEGTNCIDGEDCSTGIDLGSRAEDAWQGLTAGTRAEAILVREARLLEVWRESLCQGSPNQPIWLPAESSVYMANGWF